MIKELELLEAICRGVDPRDGTFLETPRDPNLDKIRLNYLAKLRRISKRFNVPPDAALPTSPPAMHGKPWATADDEALRTTWESDNSATAALLGARFGRGEGAILARLVHLGLFSDREQAREANGGRAAIKIVPALAQRSAIVRITEEFLASGLSARGGYSRRQLELLGVSWPPPKGWKRSVMDGIITEELAAEFVGLAELNTCEQVDTR